MIQEFFNEIQSQTSTDLQDGINNIQDGIDRNPYDFESSHVYHRDQYALVSAVVR